VGYFFTLALRSLPSQIDVLRNRYDSYSHTANIEETALTALGGGNGMSTGRDRPRFCDTD
jgi:hypothetical protein